MCHIAASISPSNVSDAAFKCHESFGGSSVDVPRESSKGVAVSRTVRYVVKGSMLPSLGTFSHEYSE